MCDPSGEEDQYIRFVEVQRSKEHGIGMKVIAGMIQCHDNDNYPPKQVNWFYSIPDNVWLIHGAVIRSLLLTRLIEPFLCRKIPFKKN